MFLTSKAEIPDYRILAEDSNDTAGAEGDQDRPHVARRSPYSSVGNRVDLITHIRSDLPVMRDHHKRQRLVVLPGL